MNNEFIYITIDNALDFSNKHLLGLLDTIYSVPDYMRDNSKAHKSNEWVYWLPIECHISDEEFQYYENLVKIKLPESYKIFLNYKHFIDLNFGHEIIFFKHTKSWITDNLKEINTWGKEITINKGLLPFGNYSDYGIACFDSNLKSEGNEYNIVWIDHENPKRPIKYENGKITLLNLLEEMNLRLEEWKQSKINGT